jgi:hypothetical protein
MTSENGSFYFFLQKEVLFSFSASPATPRASGSFLKTGGPAQRTKKLPFLSL